MKNALLFPPILVYYLYMKNAGPVIEQKQCKGDANDRKSIEN